MRTGKQIFVQDIPGIQGKEHHTDEALSVAYLSATWARAYTGRSAEEAARNGGGGVFIRLPDGSSFRNSQDNNRQITNLKLAHCS